MHITFSLSYMCNIYVESMPCNHNTPIQTKVMYILQGRMTPWDSELGMISAVILKLVDPICGYGHHIIYYIKWIICTPHHSYSPNCDCSGLGHVVHCD